MKYSVYIHIPFCRHRCSYCDFNTYAGQERLIPEYVDALCKEIELVAHSARNRLSVHTVFLGGGTPSLLPVDQLAKIMATVRIHFDLAKEAEITLEANPGTVSLEALRGLRKAGYNRISFGMQSAHPDDLRLLEREHDYLDVVKAVKWSRQAGFDNLSLDLIFGVPFQTVDRWQGTVERALGLQPEHLSMYALTIEHGTPFQHYADRGLVPMPDDDLAAEMYEWASDRLQHSGYQQYEISNWAQQRGGKLLSSQHNLQYWRNLPYLGLGAGAHGFAANIRTANVLGIKPYIQRIQQYQVAAFPASHAAVQALPVDRWTSMQEMMMVGLRLTQEGVSSAQFEHFYGVSLLQAFGKEISRLEQAGLLEWITFEDGKHLRLTDRGRLLGNQVFHQFVGNPEPDWLNPTSIEQAR